MKGRICPLVRVHVENKLHTPPCFSENAPTMYFRMELLLFETRQSQVHVAHTGPCVRGGTAGAVG